MYPLDVEENWDYFDLVDRWQNWTCVLGIGSRIQATCGVKTIYQIIVPLKELNENGVSYPFDENVIIFPIICTQSKVY